jgi:hypothetical protein
MIFVCMILAIYFLFERRSFLLGLLWLSPLLWIKMQNAVMTVIPFLMVLIAGRSKKRMIVALVAGLVLTLVGLIGLGFLNDLNKYRASFYAEDGGVGQVELLTAGVSLPIELLLSAWFFLVKPFPWAAGGAFQAIQSLENLTVCWIVFLYWMRQAKKSMEVDFVNLKIFVVASLAIYGVVVFNYGTAARYRFPFVLIFVLFADRMTLPPVKKTTPAEKIG